MADDGLRFEAWGLPHVGVLEKKFDFSKGPESYALNDRFNDLSDGTFTLPDDFPNIEKLLSIDEANHANDQGSMVRVLRGTTPIMHFITTRSEDQWSDQQAVRKFTLEGLEWILDRALVPHYDHPADPTVEPDWIYGADTLLANPYLEDSPQSKEVQHFYHAQTSGTYTLTYSGQTTSALAFGATWFDVHQALEALSNIQDVVVTGDGSATSPFEIEFLDPSGDASLLTSSATGASVTAIQEGGVKDPAGWTKSFHPQTGLEHGHYTTFEVSTEQNHTPGGANSLKVVAGPNTFPTDYPGVQQIQNVTGGRTYRAEIWVYPTTTMDFRFIVRTMDETAIDGAVAEGTATANTWTQFVLDPFVVPKHISQVIVRLGLIETGGGTFYVDDGVFAPGMPADTLGKIFDDLRTAMLALGTPVSWLTPTWTTTLDSDENAWDQDLKWNVNHDQSILQLFEYMRQWNYEWRIRWDVGDARFEWDMWNPSGGGQTRTGIAITGKSGVSSAGPIVQRPPGATYYRVEGELGRWGENASTTLDDVWGRLEKAVNDRQGVDSLELDTFASRLVNREATDTAGRSVTVEDPTILPWQAYEPGDTVTLNLAPKDTKQALRVMAIVASMSPSQATPRYDVHFVSPVLSNEAAMAQGLRTLWRKFNAFRPNTPAAKLEPPPIAGGTGGMPTIVVASAFATKYSKRKADLICTGSDDQEVWQEAIDEINRQSATATTIAPGRLVLTEGQFNISGGVTCPMALSIEGVGRGPNSTIIVTQNAFTEPIFEIGLGENQFAEFSVDIQHSGVVCFGVAEGMGHEDILLRHLYINGASGAFVAEGDEDVGSLTVDSCVFNSASFGTGSIVLETCNDVTIVNSHFMNGGAGHFQIRLGAAVVDENGPQGINIIGNRFHGLTETGGIYIAKNGDTNALRILIVGNGITNMVQEWAIYTEDCRTLVIADNVINNCGGGIALVENTFIGSAGPEAILIEGNVIVGSGGASSVDQGILVQGYRGAQVIGNNLVDIFGNHGINLIGCIDPQVIGNFLRPRATATTNVRDAIHLADCTDPFVEGNVMRVSNTGSRQFRDGVHIDANTSGAVVVGNDARGSYGSNAINDLGTGTQKVYPNHATHGDNFG